MIDVVAAIIVREGKVLIARRASHKNLAGKWEFPGGKIEKNESAEIALERELKEEFNMVAKVKDHFKTVEHSYDNFNIRLISFFTEYIEGAIFLSDHDTYKWINVSKLKSYDLAEADIPIAHDLINSLSKN